MERIIGKNGIKLIAFAALGYYLAYVGNYTGLMLLGGFVLLTENHLHLKFHLVQAFLIMLSIDVVQRVWNLLFRLIMELTEIIEFKLETIHDLKDFNSNVGNFLSYALAVFIIIAVIKLFTTKEGKVPIYSKLAKKIVA